MGEISTYSVAILLAVAAFGIILSLIRYRHFRQQRFATGAILNLQQEAESRKPGTEVEEEELASRPSLYGISYLAWILTSFVIPVLFFTLFFENLIAPYAIPETGSVAWIAYRAPAEFDFAGVRYQRHDLLVAKGSRVDAGARRLVSAALEGRSRARLQRVVGTLLLLTVFCFILLYHINILYPTSTEKNKNLLLIYLTMVIVVASAKISLFYDFFSPYLIPVPWAGMLITIFINRRIVPLIMLVALIIVSMASDFDFSLFLVLLAGGLVSGSWVRQSRRRNQVLLASIMVGVVMLLVFVCYRLLDTADFEILHPDAVAAFTNGILSGLLVLIFLPAFESIFDLASPFRLMELLDLNTPLLKEFFFKAPGTYQHSMVVANIAEAAANEIGASGLLVRVGAYYHDIGKMFNPQYFIENVAGGKSPHDELGPVASAAVVRSHVILGMKLARQIGLPSSVADFITEHHGTSTIDYFYFKSKQLDSEIKSEKVFKYPGPKPRSRETAIVMLVDSVEAAFRVLEERDEDHIRELVSRVAQRKFEQGELDRSGLTIGELKKIIETLTHILKSSRHQRIAYPGPVAEEKGNIRLFSDQRRASEKK